MSSDRLCKLGAALAALPQVDQDYLLPELTAHSIRVSEALLLGEFGINVGRETVRVHRARLCACFTLTEQAQPGREAERLSEPISGPSKALTPEGVREAVSVAPVEPQRRLVSTSRWQVGGEWKESFKYVVEDVPTVPTSYEDLAAIVERARHKRPAFQTAGPGAFVVPSGDLQLGKPDGGGTAGTVERFVNKTVAASERMQSLGGFDTVVLPWLGDCIEGMVSQGGRLALDIGVSEQLRLYRRLIMFQMETFAPLAARVIVPVIPGNHDETRRDVATHATDSWAIEGAAAVADALTLNAEAYGHVEFLFPPRGELTLAVDVANTRLGFVHGHQTGKDTPKWWAGQSFGRQAVGSADLLLTAHYHHLKIVSCGDDRTWIQSPALDGGSDWFREQSGDNVSAGMVSFVTENGRWSDLTIH